MASTITISFVSIPADGETITLFNPLYNTLNGLETFKAQRINPFESSTASTIPSVAFVASNYAQSFQVDYDSTDLFEVQFNSADNSVVIQSDDDNVFDGFNISNSFATAVVTNTPSVTSLIITNVSYSPSTSSPCSKVKVRIDTNIAFTEITEPITATQTAATFIEFEFSRSLFYPIAINTLDSRTATRSLLFQNTPPFILGNELVISEASTPQGVNLSVAYSTIINTSSASVERRGFSVFVFEYSLNNVDFQTSNTFTGLLNGTYTIYVRDNFGCVINTTYIIGNFIPGQNSAPPYFYISPSNPLPFTITRNKIEQDNYNMDDLITKNQLNYPSFNYSCPFKPSDKLLSFQVKSSYPVNTAKLVNCEGTTIETATFQVKTSNINAFDSRDAFKYTDSNFILRVFFTSGNTYNESGTVTGSFNLNGNYPASYNIGSYIRIDSNYEVITDIVFNSDFERWELLTGNVIGSGVLDTPIIASTYYNIQPYEIYEIGFSLSTLEGYFQVVLEYGTTALPTLGSAYSEEIHVSEDHENNHLFVYGSDEDNDIVWSTGFIGRFRVPYDIAPIYSPSDELDTYQSDSKLVQLESRIYDQYNFSFYGIPYKVVEQITKVLVNNGVFIDGMQLAKNSTPEIEALGASNLYRMDVTLQKLNVFSNVNEVYNPYALNTIPDYAVGSYVITNGLFLDSNGFVIDG
jgi:hypothetical protein